METKSGITSKLIISFFLISIVVFMGIYIYITVVKFSSLPENIDFRKIKIIATMLYYIKIIPFILIASLNISYSGYIEPNTTQKSLFIKPLLFTFFIIMIYSFYMIYFISPLYNQADVELSRIEYAKLLDYRKTLKNDSLNKAKEALISNDTDLAYKYLSDARFYSPDDNSINIILKTVDHDKKMHEESIEKNALINIDKYIIPAVSAFSQKNYKVAHRLFSNVLNIEPYNRLAIYYMNKINLMDNTLPVYKGNDIANIYLYDRLSETILSYENKDYWSAYKKINILYQIAPMDLEIRNYYYLIVDAIREYDFFMEDSEKIEEMYINKNVEDKFGSKNGFNIIINEKMILNIGSALYYNTQFYLFDISIIDMREDITKLDYSRFKYGKLLDTSNNENKNRKTFILKGRYNNKNNTFSRNNEEEFRNISINMSDNTLYSIRTKNYLNPEYISIENMYKLREELPSLGYNLYNIDNEIVKKILDIVYLITLSLIVIYYTYKYRSKKDKRKHIFHSFVGITGVLFILLFIQLKFLTAVDYLVPLMAIYYVMIIMILPAIFITIMYLFKIFKTQSNV